MLYLLSMGNAGPRECETCCVSEVVPRECEICCVKEAGPRECETCCVREEGPRRVLYLLSMGNAGPRECETCCVREEGPRECCTCCLWVMQVLESVRLAVCERKVLVSVVLAVYG